MNTTLTKKRVKSLINIANLAGTSVAIIVPPIPTFEVPKQIFLTGSDFAMCYMIYEEYFDDSIYKQEMTEILTDAGILTLVAAGTGYIITRILSGLLAELTNILGPLGWMASGLLEVSQTALLGLVWMYLVEKAYREKITLKQVAVSATY